MLHQGHTHNEIGKVRMGRGVGGEKVVRGGGGGGGGTERGISEYPCW